MEKWRRVWREGLAPHLARTGLIALQSALVSDDRRLLQGTTCYPPMLDVMRDRAVRGACALGFCGWQGEGLHRVGQIENFFHDLCDAADAAFNEPAACRYFLNWYDDTPRDEMRRELLAEVTLLLQKKMGVAAEHLSVVRGPWSVARGQIRPTDHLSLRKEFEMICCHCHNVPVSRPRGLCWSCYYTPGVRDLFPSTSKFGRRGLGNFNGCPPLPAFPTQATPGSAEKIAILQERARLRQSLWHPGDATFAKTAAAVRQAG